MKIIRATINWLIFLSMPIWSGTFVLCWIIIECIKDYKNRRSWSPDDKAIKQFKGEIWIWE